MSPALLWLALGQLLPAQGAPPRKAVVLPVRVPAHATSQVKDLAFVVERNLTESLARHASFTVLSRAEIAALVGQVSQQQLVGCDAESCLVEIAEALAADLLVSSQLDVTDGVWSLQSTLLDRTTTTARQRFGVRARDPAGVLSSLDTIARQLAGKPAIRLDDPNLAARLRTDRDGTALLAREVEARPGVDLATVWTDAVVDRNRESERLAAVEGGLLLLAGANILFVAGPLAAVGGFMVTSNMTLSGMLDTPNPKGGYIMDGTYAYPWAMTFLVSLAPLPVVAVSQLLVLTAAIVGVVDALDIGRVPVGTDGCCRDEVRLREATRPGWARRTAPFVAALGGAMALSLTLTQYILTFVAGAGVGLLAWLVRTVGAIPPRGPTTPLDAREFLAADYLFSGGALTFTGGAVGVGLACVVGAVLLMLSERTTSLVGE